MAERQRFLNARVDRHDDLVTDPTTGIVVLYLTPQRATSACADGQRVVMVRVRYNIREQEPT